MLLTGPSGGGRRVDVPSSIPPPDASGSVFRQAVDGSATCGCETGSGRPDGVHRRPRVQLST
ncbi:hypothetical protein Ae168Ps1_4768c [Pseudonocardia sp. Ae168_Ps1]|nr:hypothetical protein Ae168Ps1_4768c [Pseudonocardia sp. Ae168_Ps1]